MARVIQIYIRDANDFDVHEGETFVNRLTWDEMLGQVAGMTFPRPQPGPLFRMQTPDSMLEQNERRAALHRQFTQEEKQS
jgi:hypothetical protein